MKTKLATPEQIIKAKNGIGRITKNGTYQSPKEVKRREKQAKLDKKGRRAIRNARQQINSDIKNIFVSDNQIVSNTKGKDTMYNVQYYRDLLEGGNYTRKQVGTISKMIDTYEMLSEENISKAKKNTKQYFKQAERNIAKAKEQHKKMKNTTMKEINENNTFYKKYSKEIWGVISKYTWGEQGVWTGEDRRIVKGGVISTKEEGDRVVKEKIKKWALQRREEQKQEELEEEDIQDDYDYGYDYGYNYDYDTEYDIEDEINNIKEIEDLTDEELFNIVLKDLQDIYGDDFGYEDVIFDDGNNWIKYMWE